MPPDLHVVLGSSGGVGSALVDVLSAEGRPVRAVSRTKSDSTKGSPHQMDHLYADIETLEGAREACAGAKVVFFAAQPPYGEWPQRFPSMTEHVIAGAAAAGARLVMVDNLYMYGPHIGRLHEESPRNATGPKGATRIGMEKQLLDAHRTGRVSVAVGRLSDYYGPHGVNSALSALVVEPAVRGKAMRWPGNPELPRTLHYLTDAARGLITLADHQCADGEVWHLPAAAPISGNKFMALLNSALPQTVKAKNMGVFAMKIGALFSQDAKESVEIMYQWTDPFVSDATKFVNAFGALQTTPHDEAVDRTIRWMRDSWLPQH